ncbi:hypothetical protein GCM10017044_17370 [Kordiimonas sediminis]|uniref:Sulfotransferase family protein n=2 Tax=Kordiimonas sediminis TaxID=1735581 RepID=A0A919E7X2_9PROT|nr:hypothetical protein GCM10017044_17370 [Kordiimonas sediminis]
MGFVRPHYNKYQTGGLQHLLAKQIRQEVGAELFGACYKFAFVRNPWDKAISQYAYMKGRKDLRAFIGMEADADLKTYLNLTMKKTHVQWDHQHRFVLDDNGEQLVDFLGRFETIGQDVDTVLERLGMLGQKLPHTNKSKRGPYRDYYDDESREMIADHYKTDIDTFGYSF